MILVKALNIGCETYPMGEYHLKIYETNFFTALTRKLIITDAAGNNKVYYSSFEQFLSEWTDIKFIIRQEEGRYISNAVTSLANSGAL